MSVDEVPTVLDVHPPHEPVHGWRDFLLHLVTITIGLLIALSLEGLVEWRHHRHLVHEAEASLHGEIESNAKGMADEIATLHKNQAALAQDIVVIKQIMQEHKAPENGNLTIDFHIRTFAGVSWKTAQSTGALSYMPYDRAEEYADIYQTQDELAVAEQQATRDITEALAPFMNVVDGDPDPTHGHGYEIEQRIETLQSQLVLMNSFMTSLDETYKKFLAAHPE